VELADLGRGADGEAIPCEGQAHRPVELAEVCVEYPILGPEDDELTRLVGGDPDGEAELGEDLRERGGVHAPERGRFGRGAVRVHEGLGAGVPESVVEIEGRESDSAAVTGGPRKSSPSVVRGPSDPCKRSAQPTARDGTAGEERQRKVLSDLLT
jgi:hypothetical protein